MLLSRECNCELQDYLGNTALIDAVQSKSKSMVKLILQQAPDINQSNHKNETALILELKQKHPIEIVVKQLLEAGSNPELLDNTKKSAWLIAKQKHPKIARIIERHLNTISQIELPFFSNDYQAPNKEDIKNNKMNAKTPVLNQQVNNTDSNASENPSLPKKLFSFNKAKTIKTNKQEWFHAAKTGNLGGLNRMLIEGMDINIRDDKGCTALIRASGNSRRAVVSFLLQQNADIEACSDNGSTALSSSIIGNCRHVAGLLLDNNADVNAVGPSGYSYTTIAAAQWNDAMLSILYRNQGDIFICNNKQQNLLHIIALAAEYYKNVNNAKSSIRFLLDHGMDINAQDINGNTALMLLCGIHKTKYTVDDRDIASIVHAVIRFGAAPAMTNKLGKSAIDATKGHKLMQTKGVIMNALSWNDAS